MRKKQKEPSVFIEEISVEREIAEIQLERLRMISRERLLTFEETKIYDLLTKNLHLSKGKPTAIEGSAKKLLDDDTSTEDLIEIAKGTVEQLANNALDTVNTDDN